MNIEKLLKKGNNPKNKTLATTKGSLKSRTSGYIEPEQNKKFEWYNSSVKKSKNNIKESPEDKFTNYLGRVTKNKFFNDIFNIAKDINALHDFGLEPNVEVDDRLKRILSLYIDMANNDDKIAKIRVETEVLANTTGLRIYILLEQNVYKVILLDPLHLAIPSKYQSKQDTFEKNKSNGICMSRVFEDIENFN